MKNFYGTHSGEITMARPVIRKEDFSDTAFTVAPRNKEVTYDELMTATWDYLLLGHPAEKVFRRTELLRYFYSNHFRKKKIAQVPCDSPFATITVNEDYELLPEHYCNEDIAVVMDSQGGIVGVKDRFQTYQRILTDGCRQVWQKELQIDFFQKIFSAMEDDVFITDEYGFIQYINPSGEKICQIQLSDYIGKHVTELEKNSVVSQSITLEVLRTGERAEQTVKLSSGRLIMAIGLPIYNAKGEMEHVLSSSKDVKEINELLEKVANMVQDLDVQKRELENLRERMASQKNYVFESPAMKQVQKIISKVAPTDVSILIEGESGTGKEVVADFIYQCSRRHDKPFVKINCGLIPENLLESELFGYEAGAFTGADKRGKLGKIETANGGTLFFDEIGEMPLSLQVKLLEFLQDRTMVRVGGVKKIPIDVRVIAATNRDLKEMVNQGTFRGDLYYRLNVMPINLLPLKDRREDIMPLVNMFLKRFNSSYLSKKSFDQAAMEELMEYSWPGNVRELMHVVERAMITCEGDVIDTKVLSEILSGDSEFSGNIICTGLLPLKQAKAELEGILVRNAYEKCGSTYRAAEVLGVNQSTVARILKKQRSESDA